MRLITKGYKMSIHNNKPNIPEHFSFSDDTIKSNIKFLNENKGKRFDFDKTGNLYKMNWYQQIWYTISNTFSPKKFEQINKQFNEFTKAIHVTDQTSQKDKETISRLFFETLPSLSNKIYNRSVDEAVFDHLYSELTTEPEEAAAVQQSKADTLLDERTDNEFSISWPTPQSAPAPKSVASIAKVWAKMGSYIASDSGSSISYRVMAGGEKGKILGIFKASSEEPLGEKNTKFTQQIKKIAVGLMPSKKRGSLHETAAGQGYVAEVVSKKVADRLLTIVGTYEDKLSREGKLTPEIKHVLAAINTGLVPNTEIVNFQLGTRSGEVGSFQEWEHGSHEESYKFLGLKNKNYQGASKAESPQTAIPDELIDLLAIMDYATGNSDRHGENWFVMTDKDGNQQSRVSGIRLIDGGWSMAPRHAYNEGTVELGNQYKWRSLPFANKPFTELGKHVIQELYAQRKSLAGELTTLYNANLTEGKDVNELTPARMQAMDDRLEVMNRMKDGTKKALASVRTQSQIDTILE